MPEKVFSRKKIVADIFLIASIVVFSLSVFCLILLVRKPGEYVCVRVNGEELDRYSLSDDCEYSLNGGTNVLVIENGAAYISYADCPDGICKGRGKISYSGETIICLPNKLEIRIVGGDDDIIPVG